MYRIRIQTFGNGLIEYMPERQGRYALWPATEPSWYPISEKAFSTEAEAKQAIKDAFDHTVFKTEYIPYEPKQ